nr:PD-(D/E)XK nuclease family transposase [Pedobacter psychroterrae]
MDRGLFYLSRAISEQAPKGGRKEWGYKLKEVYLIAFLEDFRLPNSSRSEYIQEICLANRKTGKIFYDKMSLIFMEMLNFVKKPKDLDSDLDKWVYALKHLNEFKTRPDYLSGPEFDQLFNLAKYANLTREERTMYNASLKRKWDNKNVMDYAIKTAEQKGIHQGEHKKAVEMARQMLAENESIDKIARYTNLTAEEITAIKS